jgi:outer membrane protein OmpA-like peptidoglycan-associated protein
MGAVCAGGVAMLGDSLSKLILCLALACPLIAHEDQQQTPPVQPTDKTPTYRVTVIERTTKAVNYRHKGGATKVDFQGTDLMPNARGEARVEGKAGRLDIDAKFSGLRPARSIGPEYLTYVLWAITPEGRPLNLGELQLDGNGGKLHVTTDLQAFGMFVTAEPYFAVTRPSNLLVLENVVRPDTVGGEQPIDAKFDLLERGEYTIDVPAAQLPATNADPNTPLNLLEARNAVAIARAAGAEQYASDSLQKAQEFLQQAEDYYQRKQAKTPIGTVARAAVQTAEDARVLTIRKRQTERADAERKAAEEREQQAQSEAQAAAEREQQARSEVEVEAQRRQQAESERQAAEQAKTEAEQSKQQAEQSKQQAEEAAQRAAQEREQAETAKAEAQAQQQQLQTEAERARQAAQQAEQARQQSEQQHQQMRAQLAQQLNQVLETKETARGVVANMSDVLFDTGKASLKPSARERLAKVAGIILAYPDLKLQVEGHTDNVGSDEYNQRLSERRAANVRDYLVTQGVPLNNVIARGLGKLQPIASNTTPGGRKMNRRVELVVTGAAIGRQQGGPPTGFRPQQPQK